MLRHCRTSAETAGRFPPVRELGFKLATLLGAAGIAGVAIGFASQTSLSNIISGIFLVWEEPFQIGDVLQVGSTSGVVQSIELLSTKLRTCHREIKERFDAEGFEIPFPHRTLYAGSATDPIPVTMVPPLGEPADSPEGANPSGS